MKVYVVCGSRREWDEDLAPFILNDKVFKTRALAMREAQAEAEKFVKQNPDAKLKNYSTEIVVSSNNAGTTISYEIEELELVEE